MIHRSLNVPHLVACLLVGATAVLLCFGALVTTYDAAMAVPDWPATYGHNMFLFPFAEWFWGPWDLFLEHGHRLLGALVGLITLALAAVVWLQSPKEASLKSTVRGLVVAAVLLVVLQGLLGGARVLLDDKTVAKVHACTGPLFFAVAVAIAALTGRNGTSAATGPSIESRVSLGLLGAAYVQLVAGAQLRHLDVATVAPATFRWLVAIHVFGAVAIMALAFAAAVCCRGQASPGARRWSLAIAGLVCCQVALGIGAWFVSWGIPSGWLPAAWMPSEPLAARSAGGAAVITGHVVLGMLILGVAVALAIATGLFAGRGTRVALQPRPPRDGRPERAYA